MSMRTMRPLCPSSPGRPVSPHSVREPAYLVRGWSAGCGWRPAEVAIALDLADRFIEAHGHDDEALAAAATSALNTYHHAVGTCRMGPENDPWAVVDTRARVHGVACLRVVDASI